MHGMLRRTLLAVALVSTAPMASQAEQLSGEGPTPGTRIEIRDLRRDGSGMVTLRLRLINQSKHDVDLKWLAGAESDIKGTLIGGSFITVNWVRVGAVHLIAGTKKYLVVRDNVKTCVCAVVSGGSLPPGQTLNLWAKFPAPPESVQRVSVVVPNFDPIDNVPISSD